MGKAEINKISTIVPNFIEESNKVDIQLCQKLIKSMTKRLKQVIFLKGQAINY